VTISFLQRLRAGLPFILSGKLKRVIRLNRHELLDEFDRVPSHLNPGFLHIERAIDLVRHLGLSKDVAIVDVGAASGDTALTLANAFPDAPVYCFEPIPAAFQELRRQTAEHRRIIAKQVGLASSAGEGTMFLTHRITSSSLLRPVVDIHDSYLAANLRAQREQSITLSTLDSELEAVGSINLMKLDVQGYELEVLKGGPLTLRRTNMVLVEMQNHNIYQQAPRYYEVDAYLREAGFRLFSTTPSIVRNRKTYEWDAIYVNESIARRYDT